MWLNSLQRSESRKAGNELQGWGGSHLRKVKRAVRLHKIPERSQGAWDLFLRKLSLPLLSSPPPPFPGGSSPKHPAPCTRTKWQEGRGLLSLLHFFAQGTRWHNTRTRHKSPTAQTSVLAIITSFLCAFSSGNGASCTAHRRLLQACAAHHNTCGWSQKSKQIFAKRLY